MAVNSKRLKRRQPQQNTDRRGSSHLRLFHMAEGLPSLPTLKAEIQGYWDVLLGRLPPPVNANKVEAMMETADAYYARAMEIASMILEAENLGTITKSSLYVKFRTGPLRHFCEVAKRAADLGSRRITVRGQELESERTGRDRRQV